MYFLVDPREAVNEGYKASFEREGVPSFGLLPPSGARVMAPDTLRALGIGAS